MTAKSYDVIIVGGGPAGISTALHLIQQNESWAERILILEKDRHPREKLCGGALVPSGEQMLSDLGLSVSVPFVRVRENRMIFQELMLSSKQDTMFLVTRRDEFDAWLSAMARERGAQIHEGEPVTSIDLGSDSVTVNTPSDQYSAKVLVGADGSKGMTRGAVGLRDRGRVARLLETLTPERESSPEFLEQFASFDFTPMTSGLQGYYWEFPSLIDGKPFMNRGVFDSRIISQRPHADLKGILAERMAAHDRSLEDYDLKGHPLRWFNPDSAFNCPNVLLVGDAAGADPMVGEGISSAIGYGKLAAEIIVEAFAASDFSFESYRDRLIKSPLGNNLLRKLMIAGIIYRDLGSDAWRKLWSEQRTVQSGGY
ncbi:MAG: FAD-dependent monooxygenase [SAR202 cluster bacterium]|jgi:geranylgeranyl reductase family protein|nr:FAD-dependent monooxygenase [SAR202 cluster bacterium]MDP6715005.1 FAD-dependent monooxygenase [SAR202 cluster bacterium]